MGYVDPHIPTRQTFPLLGCLPFPHLLSKGLCGDPRKGPRDTAVFCIRSRENRSIHSGRHFQAFAFVRLKAQVCITPTGKPDDVRDNHRIGRLIVRPHLLIGGFWPILLMRLALQTPPENDSGIMPSGSLLHWQPRCFFPRITLKECSPNGIHPCDWTVEAINPTASEPLSTVPGFIMDTADHWRPSDLALDRVSSDLFFTKPCTCVQRLSWPRLAKNASNRRKAVNWRGHTHQNP